MHVKPPHKDTQNNGQCLMLNKKETYSDIETNQTNDNAFVGAVTIKVNLKLKI